MKKVKIGVIGVGHLGRFHTLNYRNIPNAELVGVSDTNPERAKEIAHECQCRAFPDVIGLLKEVEAVSIATPTDSHFKIASEALTKNIHCLIEKPITETVAQADSLIRMAADKNLVLQVGHIERYNPALKALNSMQIHPRFIESHRLAPFKPRGIEVSVVLDLMIHDIDIVLTMIQFPLKKVDASGVAVVSDAIDIANARLRFEDGSVANLTASRISQKTMRKVRFFQKDSYVTVDFHNKVTEIFKLGDEKKPSELVITEIGVGDHKRKVLYQKPDIEDYNALLVELDTFVRSINGEQVEGVSGKSGRDALSVAVEILRQIHQ
ncbi:Gfo/Idh/MocA family oxidoreductase [bacterium]|nr:Gfo/Idh/MocA family oxidoreductase [bacterium]